GKVGLAEWSALLPAGPTSRRLADLTGPASRIRPAIFTPPTSATERIGRPFVGTSEGTPRPRMMVSTLVIRMVSSSEYTPGVNRMCLPAASAVLMLFAFVDEGCAM